MSFFTNPLKYDANCKYGLPDTHRNQSLIRHLNKRKKEAAANEMREVVSKIEDEIKRSEWEQGGDWTKGRNEEMRKQQEILARDHLQERRQILSELLRREHQMHESELLKMGLVIVKKG